MVDQFKNSNHPRVAEASIGEDVSVVKDTQRFFRGRIYQMRVTSGATYTENFAAPALLSRTEQTRLLYSFSEGAGDELKDSSGHNHHGKIIGAKWVSTDSDAR